MKKGFTLIELLIVIAIITILALIAIPNFIEARIRANVSRVQADMRSAATAIESYMVDYNDYPVSLPNWDKAFHCANNDCIPPNGVDRIDYHRSRAYTNGLLLFTSLSTPIAYISSTDIKDPFFEGKKNWFLSTYNLATPPCFLFANFAGIAKYYASGQGNWRAGATTYPAAADCGPFPMRFNGPNGRLLTVQWSLTSPGPDRQFREHAHVEVMPSYQSMANNMKNGVTHLYDPSNGSRSLGNIWRLSASGDAK